LVYDTPIAHQGNPEFSGIPLKNAIITINHPESGNIGCPANGLP